MSRATGWLPAQHGAWAMLLAPYLIGLSMAAHHRPLTWGDVALGITWGTGYFAYNAVVLVLKSPPKRRGRYRAPLLIYGALTGSAGVVALILLGLTLLWWVPVYAALLGTSLYLAASKRERSLASGVVTVVASCTLMAVLRSTADVFWSPDEIAVMLAGTAYFVGTVFHVKSLIRERNDASSSFRNTSYHTVLLVGISASVAAGWLTWPWLVWAALLLGRSLWRPLKTQRPMTIGLVEIAASATLIALALTT